MAAGRPEAVDWQEAFPALRLLAALRLALKFRVLLLAAAGMVLTVAGWWVLGKAFGDTADELLIQDVQAGSVWPWEWPLAAEPLAEVPLDYFASLRLWVERSPLVAGWQRLSAPFERMFDPSITFTHFVYLLAAALWSLAVWSFFGGAITRQAAIDFARHENVSRRALVAHVLPRWGSYFAAPLFPLLGTFLLAVFLAAVGALMRWQVTLAVVGLLWVVVLVIGFLMAFLTVGLFFAWPLMWATISVEGTDAFGALSHAYSYVYQRPLRYLLYAVVAGLAGILGWYLAWLFAVWIVDMARWGTSWGAGSQLVAEIARGDDLGSGLANLGGQAIRFWRGVLYLLAFAYGVSYLWVSTTVIYFLLRRTVDGAELDEIYLGESRELHTLPQLKPDAHGVPQVADDPVSGNGPQSSPASEG